MPETILLKPLVQKFSEFLMDLIVYRKMVNLTFERPPEVGHVDTTCHTAETLLEVVRPVFEDRIISRRADVVCPPRSCDYYLWSAVQDKCYADKPETIEALKYNIRVAIGEIQLQTIGNVFKNWTDRVGYCMAS